MFSSAGRFLVQQSGCLPFCFTPLQRPPRQLQRRRFSGGVRCWEDSVTLFPFFSLFTLIPYFFFFLFFPALRRVDFVGANCVRPPAIIVPPAIIGLITGFGGGFGDLGFLGGFGRTRCAPTGFGVFWGVSGKIRRCELRSLMMGIDKRFC